MLIRLLWAVFPLLLACTCGPQLAQAEIYKWVDTSGMVNLSNVAPPAGTRVTRVAQESAPKTAAADAARETARQRELQALADRARDLEMQALSARVEHLEREVERIRNTAPPAMAYAPAPALPPVQYAVEPARPASYGCDPAWAGCGFWPGWGIYPGSVIVFSTPNIRRFHHLQHFQNFQHFQHSQHFQHFQHFQGGQHFAMQRPGRAPGGGPHRR